MEAWNLDGCADRSVVVLIAGCTVVSSLQVVSAVRDTLVVLEVGSPLGPDMTQTARWSKMGYDDGRRQRRGRHQRQGVRHRQRIRRRRIHLLGPADRQPVGNGRRRRKAGRRVDTSAIAERVSCWRTLRSVYRHPLRRGVSQPARAEREQLIPPIASPQFPCSPLPQVRTLLSSPMPYRHVEPPVIWFR